MSDQSERRRRITAEDVAAVEGTPRAKEYLLKLLSQSFLFFNETGDQLHFHEPTFGQLINTLDLKSQSSFTTVGSRDARRSPELDREAVELVRLIWLLHTMGRHHTNDQAA